MGDRLVTIMMLPIGHLFARKGIRIGKKEKGHGIENDKNGQKSRDAGEDT